MHSPNCQCNYCTSEDDYIAHVRNQFGKNAAHFDAAASGGTQWMRYSNYDNYTDLSVAPVGTTTLKPVTVTGTQTQQTKANLVQILGNAVGSAVGDLIQAKKEGETLPPLLDMVAKLGIKTEQVALNAAEQKAGSEIGAQVLKFSPYIIAGLVGVVLLIVVLLVKK